MEIEYLQKLEQNPYEGIHDSYNMHRLEGISESEITSLELAWNNGNPFPKVLKELLFFAGQNFPGFSYGIGSTQNEFQLWIREHMKFMSRVINRPFFSLTFYGGIDFLFVYLDESENPLVYEAHIYDDSLSDWIRCINIDLKDYLERIIENKKKYFEEIKKNSTSENCD